MKLESLVHVSALVAATPSRLAKIATLAAFLRDIALDEVPIAIGFFVGWPRQGKLGVGWATVSSVQDRGPADVATLELREVDQVFDQLVAARGKSAGGVRARLVGDLFERATNEEQRFLGA